MYVEFYDANPGSATTAAGSASSEQQVKPLTVVTASMDGFIKVYSTTDQ